MIRRRLVNRPAVRAMDTSSEHMPQSCIGHPDRRERVEDGCRQMRKRACARRLMACGDRSQQTFTRSGVNQRSRITERQRATWADGWSPSGQRRPVLRSPHHHRPASAAIRRVPPTGRAESVHQHRAVLHAHRSRADRAAVASTASYSASRSMAGRTQAGPRSCGARSAGATAAYRS
jgi:hypothetical protein